MEEIIKIIGVGLIALILIIIIKQYIDVKYVGLFIVVMVVNKNMKKQSVSI